MYICDECGNEFDQPVKFKEPRGEHFGTPAFEEMYGCPFCHGNFEENEEIEE